MRFFGSVLLIIGFLSMVTTAVAQPPTPVPDIWSISGQEPKGGGSEGIRKLFKDGPGINILLGWIEFTFPSSGEWSRARGPFTLALKVVKFVRNIVLAAALLIVVFLGFTLIFSLGEDTARERAKRGIFYVVIGIVVVLVAEAFLELVKMIVKP